MKEIQNAAPDTTSQLRIAVLAAMNVTDEYFTIKRQKNEVVDKLESKTIAMSDFIDKKILEFESV